MNGDDMAPGTALAEGSETAWRAGDPPSGSGARILKWTLVVIAAIAPILAAVIAMYDSDERSAPGASCVLPTGTQPVACIDTPANGGEVSRAFNVAGKTSNIPAGSHLWVATQMGNLVWPKEPEVPTGPVFNVTVVEGGNPPDGKFSIVLLLVTDEGQQMIAMWLNGVAGLPGLSLTEHSGHMTPLATVADLRLHR